jgi:hypothetical protein
MLILKLPSLRMTIPDDSGNNEDYEEEENIASGFDWEQLDPRFLLPEIAELPELPELPNTL